MIVIEIVGMDRYMLYEYSHIVSKNLANLFEVKEEEIFFQGGDNKLVYDGNDQTSWHALVRIQAPKKYEVLEKRVANYVLTSITDYILNAHVLFTYIEEAHLYHKTNKEYPYFFLHNEEDEMDEEENDDNASLIEEDGEVFEGNIFEGFEEKYREKHHCCCDDDCACADDDCTCDDGDCNCEDEHCDCHHKPE